MSAPTTPGRSPVWAGPLSLAATYGIEVSLFSSGYLDVSVPQVRLHALCIQAWISRQVGMGFPIRRSQDHSLVASFPGLFAGSNVLHRLLTPSHPPHALPSLITPTDDRLGHGDRHDPPVRPDRTIPARPDEAARPVDGQAPQCTDFRCHCYCATTSRYALVKEHPAGRPRDRGNAPPNRLLDAAGRRGGHRSEPTRPAGQSRSIGSAGCVSSRLAQP